MARTVNTVFNTMIPQATRPDGPGQGLGPILEELGFDRQQHESIRGALRTGRIGLAQNRLPQSTTIEDARPQDVIEARLGAADRLAARGTADSRPARSPS